jgi:hypothetical protein
MLEDQATQMRRRGVKSGFTKTFCGLRTRKALADTDCLRAAKTELRRAKQSLEASARRRRPLQAEHSAKGDASCMRNDQDLQ